MQSNKDITVHCIDFCEVTNHYKGACSVTACPFDNIRVSWWQLFVFQKMHNGAYNSSMLPCSRSFEVHAYYYECCQQQRISRHKSFFLVEIQQQLFFCLKGLAVVITNVGTASEFLADGWLTESVSRVVRAARTKQETNGEEPAEHALCNCIQDEMTTFDTFPATSQGLDECEKSLRKDRTRSDQDDEKEQSLSDSLPVRRQIARVHENMVHPPNCTLVRVLRLGGAKRRFVLAAAKRSCGACEAQKRPAGQS